MIFILASHQSYERLKAEINSFGQVNKVSYSEIKDSQRSPVWQLPSQIPNGSFFWMLQNTVSRSGESGALGFSKCMETYTTSRGGEVQREG